MQRLNRQMADQKPDNIIVTDQYVDVNENVSEENFIDEQDGLFKKRFRFDVKRYSHEEYIKIQADEAKELRGAVLELTDIVLSGGIQ